MLSVCGFEGISSVGDWSNGMIGVSKTFGGSSILSSPADEALIFQGFIFYFIGNCISYKKNAPRGCDLCGDEDALACPHGRAKSHKVTLCS